MFENLPGLAFPNMGCTHQALTLSPEQYFVEIPKVPTVAHDAVLGGVNACQHRGLSRSRHCRKCRLKGRVEATLRQTGEVGRVCSKVGGSQSNAVENNKRAGWAWSGGSH